MAVTGTLRGQLVRTTSIPEDCMDTGRDGPGKRGRRLEAEEPLAGTLQRRTHAALRRNNGGDRSGKNRYTVLGSAHKIHCPNLGSIENLTGQLSGPRAAQPSIPRVWQDFDLVPEPMNKSEGISGSPIWLLSTKCRDTREGLGRRCQDGLQPLVAVPL